MKTIATATNLQEALLIKSVLEGSGVPAEIPEELSATTALQGPGGSGMLRVQVEDDREVEALAVLAAQENA